MKNFIENIDHIEAYLNGELSPQEHSAFEKRIQTEPEIKEQVESVQDLIKGISFASEKKLKVKLDSVESKLNKESFFKSKEYNMSNTRKFRWIPLAASMAFLVAAGLFFLKPGTTNPDLGKLYAEYYKPDTEVIKEVLDRIEARGLATETNKDDEKLKAALIAYEKYDYKSARTQLSKFLDDFPEDQTARFYMGLTQLNMGNYALAIDYLQPLCTEETFPYKDQAKWYLSLGCTQIEGPDGIILAKKYLNQLVQDNSSAYQKNAKAFLSHME